jgi:hypothetical protein
MTFHDREPLTDEVLATPELDGLRATTLEQGLTMIRRRRQWRRMRRATGAIVCLAGVTAIVLVILFGSASPGSEKLLTSDGLRPPAVASPATVASDLSGAGDVRRLSDDELLALFPGRPVALIGPVGQQKLVFLDQLRVGYSP